jgi:hypothetical protein
MPPSPRLSRTEIDSLKADHPIDSMIESRVKLGRGPPFGGITLLGDFFRDARGSTR